MALALPPSFGEARHRHTEGQTISLIDTHLHLWDRNVMDYPWLSPPLDRDFLPEDYKVATQNLSVSKMVFVECGRKPEQYLTEVDWVVAQAEVDARIKGMVAYFPLEKGEDGRADFEMMLERKIVRGVRRGISGDLLDDKRFLEGVNMLQRSGLSYDLNITPPQMQEALDFVNKFPNLRFILNHICNPNILTGEFFQEWKKYMSEFGRLDHVACKVSGVITKADPAAWRVEDLKPYVHHVLEAFTPDRVVFGGDWPVVLRAGSYEAWANAFFKLTTSLSQDDKQKLYYKNAERIYRI